MVRRSSTRTASRQPRRRRRHIGVAALVAAVLAIAPADPAAAFYRPMPTPTGPHHYHRETNPSAAALALMTAKEKNAIVRSGGSSKTYGKVRCIANCINPLATTSDAAGTDGRLHVDSTYAPILCSWFAVFIYAKNVTGAKIWQFEIRTDYCRNSGTARIVSHKTTVHPTVYTWASVLGWEYKGTTEVSSWEPFGNNTAVRTYAQGHFNYCPPRIWCVQSKYPYAYLDVYGTGERFVSKWGA